MQPLEAAKEMLDKSGMSMYKASIETGHKPSYVQSALRKQAIGAHVLASIACACGYRLVLVPDDHIADVERGGGILIDGTTKAE